MHYALSRIHEGEVGFCAELGYVFRQGFNLQPGHRIGYACQALIPAIGRCVMVSRSDDGCYTPWLTIGQAQTLKGLRAGHFMHQMAVYVYQGSAVFLVHHMTIKQFIVQRFCHIFNLSLQSAA